MDDSPDSVSGPFTTSEWTLLGSLETPTPQPHVVISCYVAEVPALPGTPDAMAPIAIQLGTGTHYLAARMTRAARLLSMARSELPVR